jgi:hypothetical protein
VKGHLLLFACSFGLIACIGCAGKGDIVPLKMQSNQDVAKTAKAKKGDKLTVAVKPFRDTRQVGNRLGTRDSFWGSTETYSVAGGQTGATTARLMAEYLKKSGWDATQADPKSAGSKSDVILSGEIKRLTVETTGGWFSSDVTAASKVIVEGLNVKDGSVVRMTLSGAGSQGVFWYSPDDAEELVNGVLAQSFGKLVSSTTVHDGTLQLKK